jgi:uncharacterized membrane protein YfcA
MGIGAALGAIGSGGSILALPVLVYVLRVPPAAAVPMSLVLVGSASFGAMMLKWRQGNVRWRAMFPFAAMGMAGAYVGSAWTQKVSPSTLLLIFAAILLGVGIWMLGNLRSRLKTHECRISRCLAAGAAVGLLTGFLGVGGGFLLVPALILFGGVDLRQALGTSVGIIKLNSASGLLGQLRFADIDWRLTSILLAATMLGMGMGVSVAGRVPEKILQRTFAGVLIAAGLSIACALFISPV